MSEIQYLSLQPSSQPKVSIAFRHDGARETADSQTGLFWLGGFMSDMQGSKAQYLAQFAKSENRPFLRFDYSGHGASQGQFIDGTISKWLAESMEVFSTQTSGQRIIIGSSMGSWIALLLYRKLAKTSPDIAKRIKAIVLLAPAVDMTQKLMWDKYGQKIRDEINTNGFYAEPSQYGDEPYIITRDLIRDGSAHCFLNSGMDVDCPVHILQGDADVDVPWQHGLSVFETLRGQDLQFTLIKNGDHRLSTPQNCQILRNTCQNLFSLTDTL